MSLLSNQVKLDSNINFKKLGIEMLAIVNNKGRIIYSEKFELLSLKHNKIEMFLMGLALQHSMLRDFDEDLGVVKYCMTQREGRKFFSIPTINNSTILMVAKKDFENEPVAKDISQVIKYSNQILGKSPSKGGRY